MRTRAELIAQHVKGPDVLDIGSADHTPRPGSKRWVHGELVARFPNVLGLDASPEDVAALVQRGYDIVLGDAQSFSLGRKFDTVVAGELIEHLADPAALLRCAKGHLKPGGRIIITTPYAFGFLNWFYALVAYPKTCANSEHTMWFCPMTLLEFTRRLGLESTHWSLIVDIHDVDRFYKRLLLGLFAMFRWVLPKRLRCNGMLFVLEPRD